MTVTGAAPPDLPRSALADTVLERVTAVFPAAADPGRAGPMPVRTALLHQLAHKESTDTDRLFTYCLLQSGHSDLFVRGRFAPLTVREALKHIGG